MRILYIFLLVCLCIVSAKYIPQESSATNLIAHRVRRSDSDSNAASLERDDDSSDDDDNDNDNDDDNDSIEKKVREEQNKLREKEEKEERKRREKLEKEREKEIEERKKLEEMLIKRQQKEQERQEKEQRKLQERIEKEKRKLEEEKRKREEKLEKEERKRQEKLKKQLENIRKDQEKSAEDSYLDTDEEDSVEIEDIWKTHIYNKYGLSVTSTKLERRAALQRYLQEEMDIDVNSTKSERREAIIKLIQTKLQNDSRSVDSFRNLMLSHVNAARITKLRTKLEEDIQELNNKTELLNNVILPWALVAKQNIEEKKTFLQTIYQFLSNIVPNWFTDNKTSNNSNQTNISVDNGSSNNVAAGLNNINTQTISQQPSQPIDIGSQSNSIGGNQNIANGLSPKSVISTGSSPSNVVSPIPSEQSLNNQQTVLSTTTGPVPINSAGENNIGDTNSVSSSNAGAEQVDVNRGSTNAVPSDNIVPSVKISSTNSGTSGTPYQGNAADVSVSLSNDAAFDQANVNVLPEAAAPPVIPGSIVASQSDSEQASSNPSQPDNLASVNNDNGNGQIGQNGVSTNDVVTNTAESSNGASAPSSVQPSDISKSINSNGGNILLNDNAAVDQNNINVLNNIPTPSNSDLANTAITSGSEQSSINQLQANVLSDNGSLNNIAAGQTDQNEVPSTVIASDNSGSLATISTTGSEEPSINSPRANVASDNGLLNNNIDSSQSNTNVLPSDVLTSTNPDSISTASTSESEPSINSSQPNAITDNDSLQNNVAGDQTDTSVLPATVVASITSEPSNVATETGSQLTSNNDQSNTDILPINNLVSPNSDSLNNALDTGSAAEQPSVISSQPVASSGSAIGGESVTETKLESTSVPSSINSQQSDSNTQQLDVPNVNNSLNNNNSSPQSDATVIPVVANVLPSSEASLVNEGNNLLIASNDVTTDNSNINTSVISESTIASSNAGNDTLETTVSTLLVKDVSVPSGTEITTTNSGINEVTTASDLNNENNVTSSSSAPLEKSTVTLPGDILVNSTVSGDSSSGSTDVIKGIATNNEQITSNSDVVTEVTSTYPQPVDKKEIKGEAISPPGGVEVTTGSVLDAADQTTISENLLLAKEQDIVIPVEVQTSQSTDINQENVNTLANSASVTTELVSTQLDDLTSITVPTEIGASIIGVNIQ